MGFFRDSNKDGVLDALQMDTESDSGRLQIAQLASNILPGGPLLQTAFGTLCEGGITDAKLDEKLQALAQFGEVREVIAKKAKLHPDQITSKDLTRTCFSSNLRDEVIEQGAEADDKMAAYAAGGVAGIAAPWLLGVHGLVGMGVGGLTGIAATNWYEQEKVHRDTVIIDTLGMCCAFQMDGQGRKLPRSVNDPVAAATVAAISQMDEKDLRLFAEMHLPASGDEQKLSGRARVAAALQEHMQALAQSDGSHPVQSRLSMAWQKDCTVDAQCDPSMMSLNSKLSAKMAGAGLTTPGEFVGNRLHQKMETKELNFANIMLTDMGDYQTPAIDPQLQAADALRRNGVSMTDNTTYPATPPRSPQKGESPFSSKI